MFNLKRLNRALRATRLKQDPTQIWEQVLFLAITSNQYDLDTELRVLLYLRLKLYRALIDWADAMSSQCYETPMLHYRMHQLFALVRKYPLSSKLTGLKPRTAATEKFLQAEHRCKRINQRFRAMKSTNRDPYGSVYHHSRSWILYVMGSTPPLREINSLASITSGSSLGVHGNATNIARKLFAESWTVTPGAMPYALSAMRSNPYISEYLLANTARNDIVCFSDDELESAFKSRVSLVRYNKISFVPKTAKTDRSIAVEPFINSYIQKGIDQYLRLRLKRVGLDLSDQARNSELARIGSLPDQCDPYVTIDLSSASDTISKGFVEAMIPFDWYTYLSSVRCPSYKLPGSKKESFYQKFMSMGNGFCFPLETLLFASLCHGVYVDAGQKPDFRVYGDDIIVRQSVAERVLEVLRFSGFTPNSKKTFTKGPFRESCGSDWHGGVSVRPIFLDKPLTTAVEIYGFHNQSLRREFYVQHYFEQIREYLFSLVPSAIRMVALHDPAHLLTRYTRQTALLQLELDDWEGTTVDGAFFVPLDVFMGGRYVKWSKDDQQWVSCEIRKRPSSDHFYALDGVFRQSHDFEYNRAYEMGALLGCSEDRPFSLRYQAQTSAVETFGG